MIKTSQKIWVNDNWVSGTGKLKREVVRFRSGAFSLTVTPDHQLKSAFYRYGKRKWIPHFIDKFNIREHKAEELRVGDYLIYAVNKVVRDIDEIDLTPDPRFYIIEQERYRPKTSKTWCVRKLKVDEYFCRFIGLYLIYGDNKDGNIILDIPLKHENEICFVADYVKRFGKVQVYESRNKTKIWVPSSNAARHIDKFIPSIRYLPVSKQLFIVPNRTTTSNLKNIGIFKDILDRCGINSAIKRVVINGKKRFVLKREEDNRRCFINNGHVYNMIDKITKGNAYVSDRRGRTRICDV